MKELLNKMFPRNYHPQETVPPGAKITTLNIVAYLDWKDRLRVLVSGALFIETQLLMRKPAGDIQHRTVLSVMPPGAPRIKGKTK